MIIKHLIIQLMHNIYYVDTIKITKYLKVLQHVSDHRGSIIRENVQFLAKHYKDDSIVTVDMDNVGVMAAYFDQLCVCVVHCVWNPFIYSELHTRTTGQNMLP